MSPRRFVPPFSFLTVHEIRRRDAERAKRVLASVEDKLTRAEKSGEIGREQEDFRRLLDDVELAREQYQVTVDLLASLDENAQRVSSDAGDRIEDHSQGSAYIETEATHGAVGSPAGAAAQREGSPPPEGEAIPQQESGELIQRQNTEGSKSS